MIPVSCECGGKFRAENQYAGKRTRCPVCGRSITIGMPVSPSGSGSLDTSDHSELPFWWHPKSPTSRSVPGGSSSTGPSGSFPDDIRTQVFPTPVVGQAPQPPRQASSSGSDLTPNPDPIVQPPTISSDQPIRFREKLLAGLIGAFLLLLVFGAILWIGGGERPGPWTFPPTHPDGPVENKPAPHTPIIGRKPRLRLLVPAYFYPAGQGLASWQGLLDAAQRVKIVAIANPNNGPGESCNLDYQRIFRDARAQGLAVIGYVSTNYGQRPTAEVQAEIDRWIEFYPEIHGYFLDQQSTDARDLDYYLKLRDHARTKINDAIVINGPGTTCDEAYFLRSAADVFCIFDRFESFKAIIPLEFLKQHEPPTLAALCYRIPTATPKRETVQAAISRAIGSR
jgi:hypothetical protein